MKSVFKGLSFILLISLTSCIKDKATLVYDLGDVAPFQVINLSNALGTHMYESFEIEGKGSLSLINGSYFLVPDFEAGDYLIKNIDEDENLSIRFKIAKNTIDDNLNGLSLVSGFIDSLKRREKENASTCVLSAKLTDSIKMSFEAFNENSKKDLNFYELIQREGNFNFLLEAYSDVSFTEKGVLYGGNYYNYPKLVLEEIEQEVNGYIGGLWQWHSMYDFLSLNQRHFKNAQRYMRFVNYMYLCNYLKVRGYMEYIASSTFIIKGISEIGNGKDTLVGTERYDVLFKYSNLQDLDELGAKVFRDWTERIKWHHNHFVSVGTLQKNEMRFSVDCIEYREVNLPFAYQPLLTMAALANSGKDTIFFKYNELGNGKWQPVFFKDELNAVPQLNFGTKIGDFLSADRSYHFIHHKSNNAFDSIGLKAAKDTFQNIRRHDQVVLKCITTDVYGNAFPSVPVTLFVNNAPIDYTISNANGVSAFSRSFPSKGHFDFLAIVGDWRSKNPKTRRAQQVRFVFEVK
jgi:hypothetical protein